MKSLISLFVVPTFLFALYKTKIFTDLSLQPVIQSIIFGGIFYFGSSFLFSRFFKKASEKLGNSIELEKPADMKFSTEANFKENMENIGGKLFITPGKLIFKSHNMNIQRFEKEFSLDHISKPQLSDKHVITFHHLRKIERFNVKDGDRLLNFLRN